jgi:hypothetical protein
VSASTGYDILRSVTILCCSCTILHLPAFYATFNAIRNDDVFAATNRWVFVGAVVRIRLVFACAAGDCPDPALNAFSSGLY